MVFRYPARPETAALDGVSFDVKPGDVVGLWNVAALRPLLDEYAPEVDREMFFAKYGDILLEGMPLEHLVVMPDDRANHEGTASLKQFDEPPEIGAQMEVVPVKFVPDEGLYELVVPGASMQVSDWSDLTEGVIVEVTITGHNKGGLECEINNIRGFMPAGQISIYRVEDLEQFVGEKMQWQSSVQPGISCVARLMNNNVQQILLCVLYRNKD